MKTLLTRSFAALLLASGLDYSASAQMLESEVGHDRINPFVIAITGGMRPAGIQSGLLQVDYVDESPYGNRFSTSQNLSSSQYQASFGLELEKTWNIGIVARLAADVTLSRVKGVASELGLGYAIRRPDWRVIPSINYVFHNVHWTNIGTTRAGEEQYFQVRDQRYEGGKDITMSLDQRFTAWKPQVMGAYMLKPWLEGRLTVGYYFTQRGDYALRITGMGKDGSNFLDQHSLKVGSDSPNLNIRHNGSRPSHAPLQFDGLFLSLGLGFRI